MDHWIISEQEKDFLPYFLGISFVSLANVFIIFWTIYMHFYMVFNITESIEHQKIVEW